MTTYVCPLLVGRDAERAELAAAVAARRAVVVQGPAGIGKSALLRAVVDGRVVASGRATPSSALRAYRPVVDAVLRVRRVRGREDVPAALAELTGPAAAEVDPLLVADALGEWLTGEILVLEDLQWADAATIEVVEQLADTGGMAVLASARDELPPMRGVTTVRLGPVPDLVVHEIASRCLGGALTARLATSIAGSADGLPLLVEELLAALSTDGRLQETPDGWDVVGADPAVPRSVAETVEPRLARLDEADRRLLAAAAVIGRRFDWRIAAAAADLAEPAALAALRRAADLQLLDPDPDRPSALRFRHALTRDAVDALTFPPDREELASRAFDALHDGELAGDDVLTAAGLARAAGRGTDAAPLLIRAAVEAFDRHALDAAEQLLLDAAALTAPGTALHLRARQERLRVLSQMGRLQEVEDLANALLEEIPSGDTTARIEVRLRLARAATERDDPTAAHVHAAVARSLLDASHVKQCHPPRVDLEDALAHVAAGRLDDAVAAAERSVAQTFPDDPARDDNQFADVEAFALLAWARAVRRRDPAAARGLLDRADRVISGLPLTLLSARLAVERSALDLDAGLSEPPDLDRAERSARLSGGRGVVARIEVLRGVAALLRLDDSTLDAHATAAEQLAAHHALPAIAADAALLRATCAALRGQPPAAAGPHDQVLAALATLAQGGVAVVPPVPDSDVLLPFARLATGESQSPWIRHQHARLTSSDRGELAEAAAWFDQQGLPSAAEAARDRLRGLGIPFPRRRSALADVPAHLSAHGVTGRELEVLTLVAKGLSNREVAEQLVLSVRTVDKHVEHLLAKTGCANRTALAALTTT